MKIILSRKGVDSSAGGFASPIFPDGSMLSIAIPDQRADVCYRDIQLTDSKLSVAKLVKDLSRGKITGATRVHLDPDLDAASLSRAKAWQPLFGQCGAAQSHLQSQDVGTGDLFLFFGWFKQVELYKRRWRYVQGAPDQHVIFAWMQIDTMHYVDELKNTKKLNWAHYHPHCLAPFSGSNVVYTGRKHVNFLAKKTAGASVFSHYHESRCLTQHGCSRSNWRLPKWMHPRGRKSPLSYHSDIKRWQRDGDHVLLRSAARGQEFVLDLDHYPEGYDWIKQLLQNS